MNYCYLESPVGPLLVAADEGALRVIGFPREKHPRRPEPSWTEARRGIVADAVRQLREYFGRKRKDFDLPLGPAGTPFQQTVWRAMQEIPYGATISYAELAALAGKPKAARAVGSANGKNPLPIVIPCHRVIAAGGAIGGFGAGLDTKRALLAIERG